MPVHVGSDFYMVGRKAGSVITVALANGGRRSFKRKVKESDAQMQRRVLAEIAQIEV